MNRVLARQILEGIRTGRRLCWPSHHFEEEALGNGLWRVRLDGETLMDRKARLVVDLSDDRECIYVTIHAL